ncbi:MAG: oligosaccharide flippase family protein, partial [Victivallaceae bacterium]|nr:oligosaccharide flippase family protein [Victivallaceae bacterium]
IFPEILVGLQRIYLRNYIIVSAKLLELAGMLAILLLGGELLIIITLTLSASLLTNLAMAVAALRLLPKLKLRLSCDRESLREVAGFSGFVFLGILGRMILSRSSRLVISIFCGVYEVGIFQLASKAGDLCNQAVSQYQENVSPITGALHRRGKFRMLGRIVLGSMRWNSFSAFGVMLVAFILIDPMLWALFKVSTDKYPSLALLSRLFIASMYVTVALRNVPHRFFLMSERHKLATAIVFGEALLNLALNIVLLWHGFGATTVIINSLVIKIVISAVVIVPYLSRVLHISPLNFLWQTVIAPFIIGIPATIYLVWLRDFTSLGAWPMLLAGGGGTVVLYFGLLVCLIPRRRLAKYVHKLFFARRRHAGPVEDKEDADERA